MATINESNELIDLPNFEIDSEKTIAFNSMAREPIELNDLLGRRAQVSDKNPSTRKKSKKICNRNFYKELPEIFFEKYPKIKLVKEENFCSKTNMTDFNFYQSEEWENLKDNTIVIDEPNPKA